MEPEWLKKARAAGQIREKGVNVDALLAASSRGLPPLTEHDDEAAFQAEVIRFAQAAGWRVAHCRKVLVKNGERTYWVTPMDADGTGFLDLELVRERLIKVELKFGKNTPTAEQLDWIAAYERAGIEVYVWYPSDWDTVKQTLTVKRGKETKGADAQEEGSGKKGG